MGLSIINTPLKSTQSGIVSLGGTVTQVDVTISSVVTSKSAVVITGTSSSQDLNLYQARDLAVSGALTSSTNLRISRVGNGNIAFVVSWQVVEHN